MMKVMLLKMVVIMVMVLMQCLCSWRIKYYKKDKEKHINIYRLK